VPDKPGKTAVEMFQAAADGEIRALWIACTNPAQSMPDQATVRRALERAEFVVVQEAFSTTATCEFADLLLPATTWGEKTGTVTNSERCISRVRPAVAAPGSTRHDWAIATEFAQRLETQLRPGQPTLFPYPLNDAGTEAVWNEHRESTRGRDLDITGMSYALLDAAPQQWPLREGDVKGRERLYEDGVFPTPDGRARFANVAWQPVAEPRDARYPFSLTTGRLRDQWHGMSRTGTLGRLFGHVAEPGMQMNPQDMDAPPAGRRRPGARDQPARLHRGAGAGQHRCGPEPGLHCHALGPRISGRRDQHRRAAGGRQCADLARVLPHLQTARAQACRRQGAEGRSALVAAGRGLAARGRQHWPRARRSSR
jgi:predicted molibdopterin-dependent oxidoreductase YjgC